MSEWLPATAVVTGGASGIGLAIARLLASKGVTILLADLPGDRLKAAADELSCAAFACNVARDEEVDRLAEVAFDKLGTVELLLNNAGITGPRGRQWEVSTDEARAHFDVNFWGIWNVCQAFAGRMAGQERQSAIYNTGSENSLFCAVPQSAAYIAAKHAVLGLTESMREDLPPHVHLGTIIPGWVFTSIGSEERMRHAMPVDDYAQIVVPQILARRRFVVSHRTNVKRIDERIEDLHDSYEQFGVDDDLDVRDLIARFRRN